MIDLDTFIRSFTEKEVVINWMLGIGKTEKIGTDDSGHHDHAGRPGLVGGSRSKFLRDALSNKWVNLYWNSHEGINRSFFADVEGDGKIMVKRASGMRDATDEDQIVNGKVEITPNDVDRRREGINEEFASYLSKSLGWDNLVPDCAATFAKKDLSDGSSYREIRRGEPITVHKFLEGALPVHTFSAYNSNPVKFKMDDLRRMLAMDIIMGQTDRHEGNAMVGKLRPDAQQYRIFAIDNGFAFWQNRLESFEMDGYYADMSGESHDQLSNVRSIYNNLSKNWNVNNSQFRKMMVLSERDVNAIRDTFNNNKGLEKFVTEKYGNDWWKLIRYRTNYVLEEYGDGRGL